MATKSRSKHIDSREWRYVHLCIAGKNLNPDKVTEVLNLRPDDCCTRGEPIGRNKKAKQGYWGLEGHPSSSRIETQMQSILKRIGPVKQRLRRLIREDQTVKRAYLTIAIEPPKGIANACYCFSAAVINEFTSLGIDIALSIYIPGELDRVLGKNSGQQTGSRPGV